MTVKEALEQISAFENTYSALNHASGILYYDGDTVAPEGSVEIRALTLGELSRMSYELITSEKFIDALETLNENIDELSEIDKRKVKELYREYDNTRKIPMQEMIDFQIHLTESSAVWHKAKENNDFASFEPYLQKTFDTLKKFATYTDPEKDPYDVCLDKYERGLTKEKCDKFFNALREKLVPLIERIKNTNQIDDSVLHLNYPKSQQEKFTDYLVDVMDIDRKHFTVGETEHPFTINFTSKDVRITTHYYEDNLASSLYSVVHECGHALYELNSMPELFRTTLEGGVSMAIHESQSRFYENIIGRSRPFCELILPFLKNEFPEQLGDIDGDSFYRMINRSEPSLIRTEADELTYALHVMVRYELEKRMISGEICAKDLPSEWRRLYKEYLGVDVPDDKHGVLQDSHWSNANIGYFPSYALGSAYGAQMLNEMKKDIDVDAVIRSGKLTAINDWLREKIWKFGCLYDPTDLFNMVCGEFEPDVYVDYLEKKFTEVYKI
ncbi:MAG: carboxypeptidase M32 [Ruminococcaceae bacterium]|nr:carboxypeptidase M32 [Oscillospiraceae bacterium]